MKIQDYGIDMRLTLGGNFVSLKDAVNLYEDNLKNAWWKESLVAFAADYEGEHLLIETDKELPSYGRIFFIHQTFHIQLIQ